MCCGILCKFIAYIISGVGIAAIIIGAVLGFAVLPNNIRDEVELQVRLERNTPQFERWENLMLTQKIKVYFFNIDEDSNTVNTVSKPQLTEIGPFVYDVTRTRNIKTNDDDDELHYNETLQFNQAESYSNEQTTIRTINVPLMTVLQSMDPLPDDQEIRAAFPSNDNTIYDTFNVTDFLFKGIAFCPVENTNRICDTIDMSNVHYFETTGTTNRFEFAFLRHRERDGPYVITAGLNKIQDLGLIRSWRGSEHLPNNVWGTTGRCREIRGRDSTIFPPDVSRNDDFDIFYSDICRVVTLSHVGSEEFEDISGQRREFLHSTLSNEGVNSCFCRGTIKDPNGNQRDCWPKGFMELTTCTGDRMLLSYPHFLDATAYNDTVEGLEADPVHHRSYSIIEPGTGTPLRVTKRFQYNMVLRRIGNTKVTQSVPQAVVPILWIEEEMELPDRYINKLHDTYLWEMETVTIITWTLIGGGIAIFLGSLLLKLICCC